MNQSALLIINTIGAAILIQALRDAAYFLSHSNGHLSHCETSHLREARKAYAFVRGSGLDIIIQNYELDYDADRIRALFSYCVRKR